MARKLRFKGDVSEAIHCSASALLQVGSVDKAAMPEFDESCIVSAPFKPREIKRIRLKQRATQPVFAQYLNASKSTVGRWEAGTQKPSGFALKLLGLVQKHGLEILV